jgi:hypothetical protein
MTSESEKYKKVLSILRQSAPKLDGVENMEENVIGRIGRIGRIHRSFSDLIESIFAWIYIGWVRRSLVTASALLVLFFVHQQTIIMKGVNNLNKRAIATEAESFPVLNDAIEKQLMMLKLTGRRISASDLEISGKQLEQILNSYNELQEKYSDLIKIIEEDPALKESIEKKLAEERNKKSNL